MLRDAESVFPGCFIFVCWICLKKFRGDCLETLRLESNLCLWFVCSWFDLGLGYLAYRSFLDSCHSAVSMEFLFVRILLHWAEDDSEINWLNLYDDHVGLESFGPHPGPRESCGFMGMHTPSALVRSPWPTCMASNGRVYD